MITAVQCHHCEGVNGRASSLRRCWELLKPGRVFVASENVRGETDAGHALMRERWRKWLLEQGKTTEETQTQLSREDTQYFPIRVSEHLQTISHVGFVDVEVVFRSYGQAVLVRRKP